MTLPVVFTANGPSGYNLTKSLRFRSSASAYLNRTISSNGSATTWTYSTWVKRGTLGTAQDCFLEARVDGNNNTESRFSSDDTIELLSYNGGAGVYSLKTSQVFRDPSAWYNIIIAVDTTQATSSNRVKLYVNGVQVTAFSTATYPSQNATTYISQTSATHNIGRWPSPTQYFDGYLAEVNFVDGQQLTPSSFGSTNALTGVWQPAKYTGTYGTNGFYLPFTNTTSTTTLGYDFSGNSNNWTTNNISLTTGSTYDSMTDVPTLTSATTANYAVWNPLVLFPNTTYQATMSNANMLMTRSGGGQGGAVTTIGTLSGKFYAEMPVNAVGGSVTKLGVMATNDPSSISGGSEYALGDTTASIAYRSNGARLTGGTTTNSWGDTYTTGDVIGVAFDAGTGKIWFAKNGTWQASGDPAAGTSPAVTLPTGVPFYFSAGGESGISISLNCGQQPFNYTPPTGFKSLNTFNLPTSTIVKGNTVMDATTYTGNGTGQSIVNSGAMQPDFIWIKSRSAAYNHGLVDTVRGLNKHLYSNLTSAEGTCSAGKGITAVNSNGFTLGTESDTSAPMNENGVTFVGWQWQAGQGTTSSNTSGSITSTVSVNASAGFSVVTWTGAGSAGTIGHGLGVTPSMIIIKNRTSSQYWFVNHASISATQNLYLNTTDSVQSSDGIFTSRSSSTFGVGSGVASSATNYVAYCWSEIAGFSKFGSYTGNGSTDGPFVYTGFRPKFILFKETGNANNWQIYDTSMNPYNASNAFLYPDLSNSEGSRPIDILSNGVKLRDTSTAYNRSGGSYIYMAFAESPFKFSLAR